MSEYEVRLVVTARKIRLFNELMNKQRALGASEEFLLPSIAMRDELEREFQRLSAQVRATEVAA